MADISVEIEQLRKAEYGEEVREAFISAMEKMNAVSEETEFAEAARVQVEEKRVQEENTRSQNEEARKLLKKKDPQQRMPEGRQKMPGHLPRSRERSQKIHEMLLNNPE